MKSVSYIINECNRANFLERSIKDQFLSGFINTEGIDFNIIIVDDGSNNVAFKKIESLCRGKLGIPLLYIFLKRRTGNYFYSDVEPMNTALMKSSSDFVYFAASDCYVCNSNIFQLLSEVGPNKYLCPNLLRLHWRSGIGKGFDKYFSEHWRDGEHCWKYFMDKKRKGELPKSPPQPCTSSRVYSKWLATGLFGISRETFISVGANPLVRRDWGTDTKTLRSLLDHDISIDLERSKNLFAIHFQISYDPSIAHQPLYEDKHYEIISNVTVVKDEYLDIHNLIL